jgi:hypothetical protein
VAEALRRASTKALTSWKEIEQRFCAFIAGELLSLGHAERGSADR